MPSNLAFPLKTLTSTDSLVGFQSATVGGERTFTPGATGALIFAGATASDVRSTLGLGSLATQSGTFSGTSSGTNTGDQNLSGLLVKASNLSDLTSASTARTNLGLGSLATQSGTFSGTSSGTNTGDQDLSGYLTKAGNLSGLVSTSTARTNLGLGTAATRDVGQNSGNVLQLTNSGEISIGDSSGADGVINIYDNVLEAYSAVRSVDGQLTIDGNLIALISDLAGPSLGSITTQVTGGQISAFSNFQLGSNSTLIYGASVNDVTLTCPNISGTIALTSQVGDRYLTSSTTSNTIGNGAKTFTVGTGLAYTPTQNLTIVNDVAHHMHAEVTTYNSTTGVLVVDVNSHTGTGTFTAWTVNVGGISSAVIPTGGATGTVLTKASATNYDAVWSTPSVAVGGITGLGTGVATALAISVGSAGAPVVFNGAGGTPSSITLTNATGYPEATTTTAGVTAVGIASPQSPVSTNAARINQVAAFGRIFNSVLFTDFLGGGFSGSPGTASDGYIFGTGVSGTGSSVSKLNANVSGHAGILVLTTGTTTTGYASYDTFGSANTFRYDDGETVFEAVLRLPVLSTVTDEYSLAIGGSPQNNGVLGNEGAMFYYRRASYGANWQAVTRSSASQTTTDTAVAVAANTWVRLTLIVNAAGTSVTYYINGTLVATIITNIPASGAGREGCLLLKSAGTTSVTANIDYHFVGKTFTTTR